MLWLTRGVGQMSVKLKGAVEKMKRGGGECDRTDDHG